MLVQRDWYMRQIERVVAVIAHLLGLKQRGDLSAALKELQETYGELFRPFGSLVHTLEPASLADLYHDPGWLAALAQLMGLEGELMRALGDPQAAACTERARAIAEEAVKRDPEKLTNAAEILRELRTENGERTADS